MLELDVGDARLTILVEGEGPLIVLSHGFPDCHRTFRHQTGPLVQAGFRIARVAMRGYAPSTPSSQGRYDAAALGSDLVAVADALSPEAPAGLLGHDWGAIASYAAAALRPDRFACLATMSVPHLRVALPRFLGPSQLGRSFYMLQFQPRFDYAQRGRAHPESRFHSGRDDAPAGRCWPNRLVWRPPRGPLPPNASRWCRAQCCRRPTARFFRQSPRQREPVLFLGLFPVPLGCSE